MDGNGADHQTEHVHDFVQRPEPPETVEPKRYLYAWVILVTLFVLLVAQAVGASFSTQNEAAAKNLQREMVLKQVARAKVLSQRAGSGAMLGQLSRIDAEETLGADASVDSARYTAAHAVETGAEVPPAALAKLRASDKRPDRLLAQIYGAEKLSLQEAQRLDRELPDQPFVYRLGGIQALEKAGDTAVRAQRIPLGPMLLYAVLVVGIIGAALIGLVLWIVFLLMRRDGRLAPEGHPAEPVSETKADLLAVRAIQIMALNLLIQIVLGMLLGKKELLGPYLLTSALAMLVFTVLLFRMPVHGHRLSLSDIGINGHQFGRNVAWGLAGFCANLPLFFATAGLITVLSKYLPQPTHPIAELAMNSRNPMIVMGILLQGVVLAPFWEEAMFRGCLFPAISKLTKSVLLGGLIAAFMFVAIHPQGIAAWLALLSVAGMSTFLAYQTKSLVPSIALHASHNAMLLGIGLLMR